MITLLLISMIIIVPSVILLTRSNYETTEQKNDRVAREVIKGTWGYGKDAEKSLALMGYDVVAVQKRVKQITSGTGNYRIIKNKHLGWIGFTGIIITLIMIGIIMQSQLNNVIGTSEDICTINTNKHIYYDEECDKYFITHVNDWNIVNMYSIEYLDKVTAENIIEVAEIVNKWED